MKRLIISLILLVVPVLSLSVVPKVHAFELLKPVCSTANQSNQPTVCKDGSGTSNPLLGDGGIFSAIVRILSFLGGVSAVIMIIVAGLKIILSNGDTGTLATSRKQIIYAVVGIAVIIASNTIIAFVLNRVTNG